MPVKIELLDRCNTDCFHSGEQKSTEHLSDIMMQINTYSWQNYRSVQFSSVTQLSPTLCDTLDCSTPGLPVHRQLPEFTQTHIH